MDKGPVMSGGHSGEGNGVPSGSAKPASRRPRHREASAMTVCRVQAAFRIPSKTRRSSLLPRHRERLLTHQAAGLATLLRTRAQVGNVGAFCTGPVSHKKSQRLRRTVGETDTVQRET